MAAHRHAPLAALWPGKKLKQLKPVAHMASCAKDHPLGAVPLPPAALPAAITSVSPALQRGRELHSTFVTLDSWLSTCA